MLDPLDLVREMPHVLYGPTALDDDPPVMNSLLEPVRSFLPGPFFPRLELFPRAFQLPMAARDQIEDSLRIPARSWLVGFTASSAQAAGFRFNIFDDGQNNYVLTDRWINNRCAMDDTDTDRAIPYYLVRPYPIVEVEAGFGRLHIRVVNSASVANDCQLGLWFCVPGQSLAQRQLQKGIGQ